MKILEIDVCCKHTSTGAIVYDLYEYVNKNGNVAAVYYGRGPKINETNIYKFGLDLETYGHALLSRLTGYNGCFSFFSTKRLIEKIDEFMPDIIHIHELHAYFVNIRPLIEYIKKKKIPLVWTFHCEYMYTGKCGYAGMCEGWHEGCGNCPSLKDYPKSFFLDRTKEMFEMKKALLSDLHVVYVTPSAYLANRVRKSFLGGSTIKIIHNGVDTTVYYPICGGKVKENLGIKEESKVIICAAPHIMSERKGGNWLLKMSDCMMEENVEFILIGAGSKIKKIRPNVIVLPYITEKKCLAELYSVADCFVLCSKFETFSLTCAEALCCGTPIAGFKCGAPETVFEQPWAYFVDYGNIGALVKAVKKQFALKSESERIRDYANANFSKEIMCSKYLELYKSLMKEKNYDRV